MSSIVSMLDESKHCETHSLEILSWRCARIRELNDPASIEHLTSVLISSKSDCPLDIVARRETSTRSSISSHRKLSSSQRFDSDSRASIDSVLALEGKDALCPSGRRCHLLSELLAKIFDVALQEDIFSHRLLA